MRVVHKEADLDALLDQAQTEAGNAFGNPAVFLERFISRAKHIEVQVLGDTHGNLVHLHERDCSVQRRHQKVIEVAPAVGLDESVRHELCDAAVRLARAIGYNNAGTVEFLYDVDAREWFFIEMNPRIQVEHTVTEVITGIDLVRSQILVAQGHSLFSHEIDIPPQEDIPRNGYAVQARITTEDPANGFAPDYGKIINYRSAAGFGIRLDAATGDAGSVVTPYYDSMLVKLTAFGPRFDIALQRMHRALREFRIRGVKTNIPFLENVVLDETFRTGQATTGLIDTHPDLFKFQPRRDRATKLLAYLSDVTVNGNPTAKGYRPPEVLPPARVPAFDLKAGISQGSRDRLRELGPEKFAAWIRDQRPLLITDTTMRDAHQSLIATRMRSIDMLNVADVVAHRTPNLFSLEMWGGATFDTAMRFLRESPWDRLRDLRAKVPNICFQMLFRGSNAVGYSNYPDTVVAGFVKHAADSGMDIFRIFDSLNYLPNMTVAMEAVRNQPFAVCEAAICYTGDINDPARDKYSLEYYVAKARELEKMGAHILAIKDMAGLCRPFAARKLVAALRDEIGLPIHFHTHDSSGINAASVLSAAEAGVDIVDLAIASMSGSTSQPNLNSDLRRAARARTRSRPRPRRAQRDVGLLGRGARVLPAVQHRAPRRVRRGLRPRDAGRPVHQPQGTGSGDGARPPLARDCAHLRGGQSALRRHHQGDAELEGRRRHVHVPHHPRHSSAGRADADAGLARLPRLGHRHAAGRARSTRRRLAGTGAEGGARRPRARRRNDPENSPPPWISMRRAPACARRSDVRRRRTTSTVTSCIRRSSPISTCSWRPTATVSGLPTTAFFYGLSIGEEIEVEIDRGKVLFIKLISIGEADEQGRRSVFYELNGMPRESQVVDKSLAPRDAVTKPKGNPSDPLQAVAPMPGMITEHRRRRRDEGERR